MLLSNFNHIIKEHGEISPTIFYQKLGSCQIPSMCPKMHYVRAWNYTGVLISTDIATTTILDKCIRSPRKLFYVHDLEWLYLKSPLFSHLNTIYNNPEIDLIARSQSHYDILQRVWKKPIGIIDNFNKEDILKII
jgi:hypothetical protein